MYTGSHLKLILAILLVPSIFIFLIAADSENRNFITDPELTVERISLEPVNIDINIPKENKIKIKSGDTFYSTLVGFGVSPVTINEIAKDRKLKKFINLRVNDELYITSNNEGLFVKRFDENFYLDVLKIENNDYSFEKKRDQSDIIVCHMNFLTTVVFFKLRESSNFGPYPATPPRIHREIHKEYFSKFIRLAKPPRISFLILL